MHKQGLSHLFFYTSESRSVVSDSLQPRGLYSPWNSPGQNSGVGSLSLLQGIFPTQGSKQGLLHCRRILCQLSHKGSPFYFFTQMAVFRQGEPQTTAGHGGSRERRGPIARGGGGEFAGAVGSCIFFKPLLFTLSCTFLFSVNTILMTTSYPLIEYVLSVIFSQLHSIPHGVPHNLPKLWPLQSQAPSLLSLLQTWGARNGLS